MKRSEPALSVSLVSHTNVGKTTLARTLLRRDVGDVLDQAHVTEENEPFTLLASGEGEDEGVLLWDTPGLGDSARLLERLQSQGKPLQWMLGQTWDRFSDRPLWCSQQAVKNVRENSDVVLYLVNATEEPSMAGYVDSEMKILEWIERPVIVVLNQTGPPSGVGERSAEEERWREHLSRFSIVREVVSLDAFARCWVQEGRLLELIRDVLAPNRRPPIDRLIETWGRGSRRVFFESMDRLAELLSGAAADRESLPESGLGLGRVTRRRAVDALAQRLQQQIGSTIADLVELHGLYGRGAAEITAALEDVTAPDEKPDPWRAGVLGGVVGGALGGLAADVASGGLSFGGGAVGGALLGGMGLGGLAWGNQLLGGDEAPRVTWSTEFLERATRDAMLRYLSVAHFGRGSGEFRDRAHPTFWREAVAATLERHQAVRNEAWELARGDDLTWGRSQAMARLSPMLRDATREVLLEFYPGTEAIFEDGGAEQSP